MITFEMALKKKKKHKKRGSSINQANSCLLDRHMQAQDLLVYKHIAAIVRHCR